MSVPVCLAVRDGPVNADDTDEEHEGLELVLQVEKLATRTSVEKLQLEAPQTRKSTYKVLRTAIVSFEWA